MPTMKTFKLCGLALDVLVMRLGTDSCSRRKKGSLKFQWLSQQQYVTQSKFIQNVKTHTKVSVQNLFTHSNLAN